MAEYNEAEASDMAEKWGKNATEDDIKNVEEKMDSMNRGPLAKVWDKVKQLWVAFKSPNTPAAVKAMIIGGLIYMVSPIDLIPDFVPILGLTDDAGVIGVVFANFVRLAGTAAIGAGLVISVVYLNRKVLKKEMEKRNLEKLIVKELPNANTINCLGIKRDGTQEGLMWKSKNPYGSDIYKGMELTNYA